MSWKNDGCKGHGKYQNDLKAFDGSIDLLEISVTFFFFKGKEWTQYYQKAQAKDP